MCQPTLMIYGATGYTGQLIAAQAVALGLEPILAGRNAQKLASMARKFGLETRAFDLGDADRITAALENITVVLHCAGPFVHTATPMFEACLRTGTHYLDITGEIDVFESLAARDAAAKEARIMVLPGAGFDVVPSDCLIADLAARYPGGQYLRLGLAAHSGASRGTMRTVLESITNLRIRRNGAITRVAAGSLSHDFDFGVPPRTALVGVLGDVSTAYWSTGIPNIAAYGQATSLVRMLTRMSRLSSWLPGRMSQLLLSRWVERASAGPSESERRESYAILVAEIEDANGRRAAARLRTPDPYDFTAEVAVTIATRALHGDIKIGYQTPSLAYGADLIRQFPDVQWGLLEC